MVSTQTGHNGDPQLCWTDLDISFPGEQGNHYRIQREWKGQVTGTWGTDQVEFRLSVTSLASICHRCLLKHLPTICTWMMTETLLPVLAPSSRATSSLARGMATSALYRALPSPFYFTFGAELDTLTMGKDTLCKGNLFTVKGARLADVCTALTLVKTAAQYQAIQGGAH
ncbi:MAG: hypothetical protein U0176_18655 [Bacteroidia bacterium]